MNSALFFIHSPHWVKRGKNTTGELKEKERPKWCLFAQELSLSYTKVGAFFFPRIAKANQVRHSRTNRKEKKKRKYITILLKAVDLVWTAYISQSGLFEFSFS